MLCVCREGKQRCNIAPRVPKVMNVGENASRSKRHIGVFVCHRSSHYGRMNEIGGGGAGGGNGK